MLASALKPPSSTRLRSGLNFYSAFILAGLLAYAAKRRRLAISGRHKKDDSTPLSLKEGGEKAE